jgi:SAM-dependent methyltransferase
MRSKNTIFICPSCKAPFSFAENRKKFSCKKCGYDIRVENGVALLIADRMLIDRQIADAKQGGKADWYEAPQSIQFEGPYRHHVKKRRAYLDHVLASYKMQKMRPLRGLDLGCGDGENLQWLSGYVNELYGSDYNLLRLHRAAGKNAAKLIFMADVTDYPVSDDSFDVIFLNHVLEHIRNDERALSEVFRVLKPGGLMLLGVPNEGAFFWRLAYRFQPEVLAASDHVQFYTAKTLRVKCACAGFRIKEVHPIGWGVPHWKLDEKIRGYKIIDDVFEMFGRIFFPSQATSLYLIATK